MNYSHLFLLVMMLAAGLATVVSLYMLYNRDMSKKVRFLWTVSGFAILVWVVFSFLRLLSVVNV